MDYLCAIHTAALGMLGEFRGESALPDGVNGGAEDLGAPGVSVAFASE